MKNLKRLLVCLLVLSTFTLSAQFSGLSVQKNSWATFSTETISDGYMGSTGWLVATVKAQVWVYNWYGFGYIEASAGGTFYGKVFPINAQDLSNQSWA